MSSIIERYNYDIFISYRQKDNKGDRWVSEFVEALKTELESTFKEEISVYFDINPHDGLLETHDVDASLKEKLKCLVFIPIISRTYCDPKSFAWEHEFKAFIEQASQDQFGLKIKLPNGNVASRVIPVRIHDLDAADIKECESVLGGLLRGVEFIYKETGVDKPLAAGDNEKKNLNNTVYRIQIIKVAHALKEIIQGMKAEPIGPVKESTQRTEPLEGVRKGEEKPDKRKPVILKNRRLLSSVLIAAILITVAVLIYPKIFKHDKLDELRSSDGRISVAVMPFQNMTNDTAKNFWQDMIQDNLITSLSNSEELIIRQTETIITLLRNNYSTNYASITPSVASNISQKLDANVFIHGSIRRIGTTIRLNARVVDSETEEVLKSYQIDGSAENILQITDSLSGMVRNFLIISHLKKGVSPDDFQLNATTSSAEAYSLFLLGNNAFRKWDFSTARKMYLQAIAIDSNFIEAALKLSITYYNMSVFDEAKKWCIRAYGKRAQMPLQLKINTNRIYAILFETPNEEITYLRQVQELDDLLPSNYYSLGYAYSNLFQFEKAIPEYEKSLEIYNKLGIKPAWVFNYTLLGIAYNKTGQYRKEKKLYLKAEKDFPDNPILAYNQVVLALTEGDTVTANRYAEIGISYMRSMSVSEASIDSTIASAYADAGLMDKAEEYYRQALSLEPENPDRLNTVAYFLIDKERNIIEGMGLADKALNLSPAYYEYLHTKGWGLYKQGKYQEALEILQKSWDLRREKAVYNHEAFLHLEAAKKAAAVQ
jgi:tetratricopeptide (TPR) repeat protein